MKGPQSGYLDPETPDVHILHLETLDKEFDALMDAYNIMGAKKKCSQTGCGNCACFAPGTSLCPKHGATGTCSTEKCRGGGGDHDSGLCQKHGSNGFCTWDKCSASATLDTIGRANVNRHRFGVGDLNDAALAMIHQLYRDDFTNFNYSMHLEKRNR